MKNSCSYFCRQQHSSGALKASLVTESLPYFQRTCLLPTAMFRFVTCASSGSFWSREQPFCTSSAAVVTWQQDTKFQFSKPVKISGEGFAETGGFGFGALVCQCKWSGLAHQWGSSTIHLASEMREESPSARYTCPLPKACRRCGGHQATCARSDI